MRFAPLILVLATGSFCCAGDVSEEGKPLTKEELRSFLNDVVPTKLDWRRLDGPDFVVYYGHTKPPSRGSVGFYLGGWPWFKPDASLPTVDGQLGIYPVKWQKKMAADGALRLETLISMHSDYWKAHVWIEAKSEADLKALLDELSILPTFITIPRPVGAP